MNKITIDKEFSKLIPELSEEEYEKLEQNIIKDGCREPLSLWNDILIDGHNRYKICQKHDIKFNTIEIKLTSRNDTKIWIINNQLGRRNLVSFQRIELVAHLEPLIAAQAKEKQQEGGKTKLLQNFVKAFDTQKKMAKKANVSHDTYYKGKEIIEKASEEDKEALRQDKTSINKVYSELKAKEKTETKQKDIAQQKKDIASGKIKLPEGKFEVIAIDPPWPYGGEYDALSRRVSSPYPEMSIEGLKI